MMVFPRQYVQPQAFPVTLRKCLFGMTRETNSRMRAINSRKFGYKVKRRSVTLRLARSYAKPTALLGRRTSKVNNFKLRRNYTQCINQ